MPPSPTCSCGSCRKCKRRAYKRAHPQKNFLHHGYLLPRRSSGDVDPLPDAAELDRVEAEYNRLRDLEYAFGQRR